MFLESVSLFTDGAAHSNVGTAETTMSQYTLPANSMPSGLIKGVHVVLWGGLATNANGKSLRLYFGSSVIALPLSINAASNKDWIIFADILWRSSAVQSSSSSYQVAGTLSSFQNTSLTQTDTADIIIKSTSTSDTASGDVTQNGMYITRII